MFFVCIFLHSIIVYSNSNLHLLLFNVQEVYSDWPPALTSEGSNEESHPFSHHQTDKMDKTDEALAELYSKALKAMQDAESLSRGDSRQDSYVKSKQMFEKAMDIAESLALFSDNETVDDIATVNLKYLLIPAYLAKITMSAECGPNRLNTFIKAESYIKKFFQRILKYGLGSNSIEQALESSDSSAISFNRPSSLESAMRDRTEKIEKFKRMKLLESRLEELESRIGSGQEVDDEIAREYYLSLIKKYIEDTLETLEREVRPAILFERNRPTNLNEPSSSGSQKIGLFSKKNQTITIVKDQLQKQVFGLGYPSRPTVTVDEFITKKINDGDLAFHSQKEIYANSLQKYAEQPSLRRGQEELSDEERETKEERDDAEELARKRRWDEFKDANPRGSGNRHNMG